MFARFSRGVLVVVTGSGTWYVKPSTLERVSLLWIFRHFRELPINVFNARDQKIIECVAFNGKRAFGSDEIIGTVDCRPLEKKPPKRSFGPTIPVRESVEA
jgi:hypothetical protein